MIFLESKRLDIYDPILNIAWLTQNNTKVRLPIFDDDFSDNDGSDQDEAIETGPSVDATKIASTTAEMELDMPLVIAESDCDSSDTETDVGTRRNTKLGPRFRSVAVPGSLSGAFVPESDLMPTKELITEIPIISLKIDSFQQHRQQQSAIRRANKQTRSLLRQWCDWLWFMIQSRPEFAVSLCGRPAEENTLAIISTEESLFGIAAEDNLIPSSQPSLSCLIPILTRMGPICPHDYSSTLFRLCCTLLHLHRISAHFGTQ